MTTQKTHNQTSSDAMASARRHEGTSIQILPPSRDTLAGADAIAEAQLTLANAQQNLLALVQGAARSAPGAPFAFPASIPGWPQAAFAAAPWQAASSSAPSEIVPIAQALQQVQAGQAVLHAALGMGSQSSWPAAAWPLRASAASAYASPAPLSYEILDQGREFVCLIELPGIRAENVDLTCVGQSLALKAVREVDSDNLAVVYAGRGSPTIRRTLVLPAPIEATGATSNLRDGILTVHLPKTHQTDGPSRINVQS
ncbi:MAG: Hsp20/alpha crystallin family protein [Thermoplasmatota archaeon]